MEQYITPERTANAIMQDSNFKGYYLIVEGKKDVKFYGKFINDNEICIKPAFGNAKVKKILELLDERGFEKKIGIIDSDFRKILNITESIGGLFITDDHDVEVMIIKTKALESVLNIYCSKSKIKEFETQSGCSIRHAILSLGKEVGYLKLANKIYNLGLVFKPINPDGNQIKYSSLVCEKTLNFLGSKQLIQTAINYSRNKSDCIVQEAIIIDKHKIISEQELDLFQLVNGHDLTNFLYVLMKKVLKSNNKMLVDYNSIEDSLILACDYSYFKETVLYNSMLKWSIDKGCSLFE